MNEKSFKEGETQDSIPDINIDATPYRIQENNNIPLLNVLQDDEPVIFRVSGKLINVEYHPSYLALTITNDTFAKDAIEWTRILKIEVFSSENIRYFFNAGVEPPLVEMSTQSQVLSTENAINIEDNLNILKGFVGKEFSFKITKGTLKLFTNIGVSVWCPVEYTLEEMKGQMMLRHDRDAKDSKKPLTSSHGMVKQETHSLVEIID